MAPQPEFPARRRAEGLAALLGVQLCFGLSPLFAKWTLDARGGFEPRALVAWRIVFGAVCLGALAAVRTPRRLLPPRAEVPRLVLCALLGIVMNMWGYLEGVSRTSAMHAGLLVVQIPVFTYALACLARLERPVARRVLGIVLGMGGAVVLVLERRGEPGGLLGNLLILANCLAYSGYLVLARGILARHSTLLVMAWIFGLSLPFVPLLLVGVPAWPEAPPARVLGSLAYTLAFGTFLAYVGNAYALARVPASTVAVFIFLQPLVAGVAGVVALDERITPSVVLAGIVLLAGIGLVSRAGPALENAPSDGTRGSIQRVAGRVFHSRR